MELGNGDGEIRSSLLFNAMNFNFNYILLSYYVLSP